MLDRTPSPDHTAAGRRCAAAIRTNLDDLVDRIISDESSPKDNRFNDPPDVLRARVKEACRLLAGHLEGKPHHGALYAGQRAVELVRPELSSDENLTFCRQALDRDRSVIRAFLAETTGSADIGSFEHSFDVATASLTTTPEKHVRTLFVGDCLMAEIATFLIAPLAAEGIAIDPFPINSRDPASLQRVLTSLATNQYDAIFFSPFSHARTSEIETFSTLSKAFLAKSELEATVSGIIEQTRLLLDFLSAKYECPIFVHNAAFLQRSQNAAKAAALDIVQSRNTGYAKSKINSWLAEYIASRNATTFQHLFLIDEDALAAQAGRTACSRYLYASEFQHATVFSEKLAQIYHSRIAAVAGLVGKKLVICDLDNTIWDGVIGEGAVSHYSDRQQKLKALKDHGGVVLSIASKNDAANVHFSNGVLCNDDFVCPQINWGSKVDSIARIKKTLNLQTKHMVFIDDRPDERALVQEAFPDILTLDACDPETWTRIGLWSHLVHGSSDLDRTKLYQEQAARDAATSAGDTPDFTSRDQLKKLGLAITVERAGKSDLKRVSELINRTNQWNLTGAKTTFEQVRRWHDSKTAEVLIGSAADKFGNMGTVCVAIAELVGDKVTIPVFVLSCRVFGYGVETAMLAAIFARWTETSITGRFVATNQNHLCARMYIDHGFSEIDPSTFQSGPRPANPTWAAVHSKL